MKTLMITLALAITSISFAKGHDNNPVMKETVKKWMHHHLTYPNKAIREKKEGIVFVSFVIDENGKVNEAQIIQGVSEEIDAEALRVVKSMELKLEDTLTPKTYILPLKFEIK